MRCLLLCRPVFVTHYPRQLKPFYMKVDESGVSAGKGREVVQCMDLLMPGLGELIGGSCREERYEQLRQRMLDAHMPLQQYAWYLELRQYGSVPHSGFGLGFERYLRLITGIANLRDLIPVPRGPGSMRF